MKRCPECRRDYYDETLLYCLDDGTALLEGPASDEPATAILSEPSESATKVFDPHTEEPGDEATRKPRYPVPTRNSIIAGVAGILLLAALGIGSYWFYGSGNGNRVNSIAVLPFQNKSGDADSEYLSDGLAESLIHRLSQLPDLKVSPTNSVLRYKGKDADLAQVARELAVDAIISGRLVQRGENLTISVELVDGRNNKLLWGEQYNRKMADLLTTQREIAAAIAQNLRLQLSGDDAKGLTKQYTNNNEAYQQYLKGRYFWGKRTPESIRKAIEYFNLAIENDPSFAMAYSGLADAYVVPANRLPPRDAMPKAKAAAMRALEIDDTLAEAHTSLARVLQVYEWNWNEAEKEYKRAIELNPRYPVAHQWYGGLLERTGHPDKSISERKQALELDPLSTIANFELAQAFYFVRDNDRAIEQFKKALELDPSFPAALQYLPLVYAQKGMYDEAVAMIRTAPIDAGIPSTGVLGYVYAMAGHKEEARNAVDQLKRLRGQQYIPAASIAMIHAGLGEKDDALDWLEKGYEERGFQMQFLRVDPKWDSLRDEPRFVDLVKRIGLPG